MLSMRTQPAILSQKHLIQAVFTTISEGSMSDNNDGENKYSTDSDILIDNDSKLEDELFHTLIVRM
jgi:hypothetical protein